MHTRVFDVKMPRFCFFGTSYSGKRCACGWEKSLENELPEGYQANANGYIQLYVRNIYDKGRTKFSLPSTTYGCTRKDNVRSRRKSEEAKKFATFILYHETNRVKPNSGEWSEPMKTYFKFALVKKSKGCLTCIGVASEEQLNEDETGMVLIHSFIPSINF